MRWKGVWSRKMNPRLKVLKKWTLSLEHLFLSFSTFEFRTKWKEFIQEPA
jgi:hypothetical protein